MIDTINNDSLDEGLAGDDVEHDDITLNTWCCGKVQRRESKIVKM